MIVVDANFLVLLLDPTAMPWIERGRDRVAHLIAELTESREEIMIPAPIIAEVVAGRLERVEEVLTELRRHRAFMVQPFDEVIAIETGILIRRAVERVPSGERQPGWRAAMKYDAMVAATARVRRARALCSADEGLTPYLDGSGIEAMRIGDLPLPPANDQADLGL